MTEQEFLVYYSNYYGEKLDSLQQLAQHTFTGEQLFEFVNATIKADDLNRINAASKNACLKLSSILFFRKSN